MAPKTVGERIRERRMAKGWKLVKLAAMAETSHGYLSDVENGKVDSPNSAIIARVAKALDTSTDYLLGLTDDPTPPNRQRQKTLEERLAELGITGVWARGGVTEEDLKFILTYLETQQRLRDKKGGDK